MREKIAVLAAVLILAIVNYSIWDKERHLESGRIMLLELAPLDPRSLMQGDYMALNYAIANQIYVALPKRDQSSGWPNDLDATNGAAVVGLDENDVAHFIRIHGGEPLAAHEHLLRYRVRSGQLKFATNAYFFEEGTADHYTSARYGLFRINEDGEPLLTHLVGADFTPL